MQSNISDYDFDLVNDVVVIYDLNQGNKSVTNDVETVLLEIQAHLPNLAKRKIIYRDSDNTFNTFDGINNVNQDGKFLNFYPTRETELNNVLRKLNAITQP